MARVTYRNSVLVDTAPPAAEAEAAQRVRRAMHGVAEALSQQKAEIRQFKETIEDLGSAVRRLEDGWRRYDQSVKRINVSPLRRRARRLARIMDTV